MFWAYNKGCGADFGWSLQVRRDGRGAEGGCVETVVGPRGWFKSQVDLDAEADVGAQDV
jgi:hypothetical protein